MLLVLAVVLATYGDFLSKRVLAISSDLDQLRRIVATLERAGAEVDAVRSPSAIAADVIPHRYVFYATSGGDTGQIAPLIAKLRPRAHVTIVAPQASLSDLTSYLRDDRVNHVVVGEELDHGVFVTAQKLLTGDIFGIEKYLPGGDAGAVRADPRLRGPRQGDRDGPRLRRAAQDAAPGPQRDRLGVRGAADERALRRAGRRATASRSSPRSIRTSASRPRSPRPVSIRYAATDQMFAVAVRDRFGRLAKNTILSYIDKCITSPNQIDRKTYGAGLGLYLVANAAASLHRQRRIWDRHRGRVHVRSRREGAAAAGRRVRPPGRRRDAQERPTRDRGRSTIDVTGGCENRAGG